MTNACSKTSDDGCQHHDAGMCCEAATRHRLVSLETTATEQSSESDDLDVEEKSALQESSKSGQKPYFLRDLISHLNHNFLDLSESVSTRWVDLVQMLTMLCLGSSFGHMVFFLFPVNSVNDGLAANRGFFYGILTCHELIGLLPWVETFNLYFAQEDDDDDDEGKGKPRRISLRLRMFAVMVGLIAQKLFGAMLAENWWSPGAPKVFPIPFSTIVTGVVGVPCAVATLYFSCPGRNEAFRKSFAGCVRLLVWYHVALFVAGSWAVVFRRLSNHWTRYLWALSYALFKALCKLPLEGPTTTTTKNPLRRVTISLVVEIIFARVQASTLPYIASQAALLLMVTVDVVAMYWRVYSGGHYCALLVRNLRTWIRGSNPDDDEDSVSFTDQLVTGTLVARFDSDVSDLDDENSLCGSSSDCELGLAAAESTDHMDDSVGGEESSSAVYAGDLESCPYDEALNDMQSSLATEEDTNSPSKYGWVAPSMRRVLHRFTSKIGRRGSGDENEKMLAKQRKKHVDFADAVSSEVATTMVFVHNLLAVQLIRYIPIREYINASFQIDDAQWMMASFLGWHFVLVNIHALTFIATHGPRVKWLGGEETEGKQRRSMKEVICCVFRDQFWFLFLWMAATGSYACANMINHFGADFSLEFQWLACRETPQMAWPGCLN